MAILKLEQPILIDNVEVCEFTHDPLAITTEQYLEACMRCSGKSDNDRGLYLRENNYSLHFHLGIMAILASNPQYAIEDIKRVKGNDILQVSDIGLLFTCRKWEDSLQESNSGNAFELTADTSAQQEQTLEECDL